MMMKIDWGLLVNKIREKKRRPKMKMMRMRMTMLL